MLGVTLGVWLAAVSGVDRTYAGENPGEFDLTPVGRRIMGVESPTQFLRSNDFIITPTKAKSKVLIISGMGPDGFRSGSRSNAKNDINRKLKGNAEAQIWDWTRHEASGPIWKLFSGIQIFELLGRLRIDSPKVDMIAQDLARRLTVWREEQNKVNADTKLYVICGSAGANILLKACDYEENGKHLISEDFFRRVFFVSVAITTTEPLARVADSSEDGIYNYCCEMDTVLVWAKPFYAPGSDDFVDIAGHRGYRKSETPEAKHITGQLRWSPLLPYDNDGKHLGCYYDDYFEDLFFPLLREGQTPPAAWRKVVQ
jgi:hypothetical protein